MSTSQQEGLIIEGLCPKCESHLGFKREGVWECQNPDCAMLIFSLSEGETVYKSTCRDCGAYEWGVGPLGVSQATCPKCNGPCTLMPEEEWQE